MDIDPQAAAAIRDAANDAAERTGANGMTQMGAIVLIAAHAAYSHCGGDAKRQDQWFSDFVAGTKLQLEAEGHRQGSGLIILA